MLECASQSAPRPVPLRVDLRKNFDQRKDKEIRVNGGLADFGFELSDLLRQLLVSEVLQRSYGVVSES